MSTSLIGDVTQVLKRRYPEYEIKDEAYEDNTLLAMLPKDQNFDGEDFAEVLQFSRGAGTSAVFATARGNRRPDRYGRFLLPRRRYYAHNAVETEAILAAKSRGEGALLNILERTTRSCIKSHALMTEIYLFGNGGGALGRVNTTDPTGGTTVTLADSADAVKFHLDMVIDASSDDGTGGAGARNLPHRVTGINRQTGVITVAGAFEAAWAANDFIFEQDCYNNVVMGLEGYLPASAPGVGAIPGTLFGLDRTPDTDLLGGVRFDGSAMALDEAVVRGISEVQRIGGGETKVVLMNSITKANFVNLMQGRARIIDKKVGQVGFRGLEVEAEHGTAEVYGSRFCPTNRAYCLDFSTFTLRSLGPSPNIFDLDGTAKLRMSASNEDAVEFYGYAFQQLGCRAPGQNGRITLP